MNIDFEIIVFYALAATGVVSGAMVLIARDVVRVAFWLLSSLSAVAGLYLHLGADFLGLTQVLVYIGGILVLILFGIMMTQRDPGLVKLERKSTRSMATGVGVSLVLFLVLASVINSVGWASRRPASATPTTQDLGTALLTDYVLPFELISVLLLVVLCGAAYLARRRVEQSHA